MITEEENAGDFVLVVTDCLLRQLIGNTRNNFVAFWIQPKNTEAAIVNLTSVLNPRLNQRVTLILWLPYRNMTMAPRKSY